MSDFELIINDASRGQRFDGVSSFVGEDASGSFGLLAGHSRMMTTLVFGLARFRIGEGPWQYLALPGAVLYFVDNALYISTRRYIIDEDYVRISTALQEQLLKEEQALKRMKTSLHQMLGELLKRMWEIGRRGAGR